MKTDNDTSVESLIGSLFSIESEEDIFDDNPPIEDYEMDEITEECYTSMNDLSLLNLGVKVAQEYVFSKESISDDISEEGFFITDAVKKFWGFIVKVVKKMAEHVGAFMKRIKNFIQGPVKVYYTYAKENGKDITAGISKHGKDISLKMKKPVKYYDMNKVITLTKLINSGLDVVKNNEFDKYEKTIEVIKASSEGIDYEGVQEVVYGPGKISKTVVTMGEFDKIIGIVKTLTNLADYKKLEKEYVKLNIIVSNYGAYVVGYAPVILEGTRKEKRHNYDQHAQLIRELNYAFSGTFYAWIAEFSFVIKMSQYSYLFAKKAVKAVKADEKTAAAAAKKE